MPGAGAEAVGGVGEPVQGEPGGQQGSHHHPARLEGIQPEVPVPQDGHPCQECGERVQGGQEAEHVGAHGWWQQPGGGGQRGLRGRDTHHRARGSCDQPLLQTDQQQEGEKADEEVDLSSRTSPLGLLERL